MKAKLIVLLLATLLFTGCSQLPSAETNFSAESSTNTEETTSTENTEETTNEEPYIVTFEASTIEEETITSDIFADSKLTMLNVWASYCNPCLNEMPDLAEIALEYDSAEFQMLGIICDVSVFSDENALSEAMDLIEDTGATTYPHLLLNDSLYSSLVGAIDSVPTTFFINQKGEMLGYVVGSRNKESWENIINELLAEME